MSAPFLRRVFAAIIISTIMIFGSTQGHTQDITTGLVDHWALNETSGTTATDTGSGGNNGTMQGSMDASSASVPGINGTALTFNGSSDYIETATPISMDGNITVSLWINYPTGTDTSTGKIFFYSYSGSGDHMIIAIWNDRIYTTVSGTYSAVNKRSSITLSGNNWYHVVVQKSAGNIDKIYINGADVTADGYDYFGIPTAVTTIGSAGAYGYHVGDIDDVRIYNRALTAADVTALYDASFDCNSPNGHTGEIIFNDDKKVMQYCNGTNWVAMGAAKCKTASCGGSSNERIIFMSSSLGQGSGWNGVSGADAICQANAQSAGLNGTYLAWIADSNPSSAPATRFEQATVPYVIPDGTTIANNWTDLTDGTLSNAPLSLPDGTTSFTFKTAMTNVNADGTQTSSTNTCSDFSSNTGNIRTGVGYNNDSTWTDNADGACSVSTRIYCVEQSNSVTVIPDGLVGYWKLDETSGTTAADSSGNGNNGTWNSDDSPTSIKSDSGKIGTAISLDGTGDYVDIGTDSSLDISGDLTLSAWVYISSYSANNRFYVVGKNGDSTHRGYLLYVQNDGTVNGVSYISNTQTLTSKSGITTGSWHHIVYTRKSGEQIVYLDGTAGTPTTATGTFDTISGYNGAIGGGWNTNAMDDGTSDGKIDDVRIYNRALSADEITTLYQKTGGISCTNPDGHKAEIIFNDDYHVMQYCNGTNWVAMGPPGNGGSSCSNPSGLPAELIYNADLNVMQYCEGDQWIAITPKIGTQLLNGLVGWWKMDETSGTTIADSSGNGNDAEWWDNTSYDINNDESILGGIKDGALSTTTSTTEKITVNNNIDVSGGTGLTLSVWVFPMYNSSNDSVIIAKSSDTTTENSNEWELFVNGAGADDLAFRLRTVGGVSTQHVEGYKPPASKWTLLTVTYDSATGQIVYYANGTQIGTDTYPYPGDIYASTWTTGLSSAPYSVNGWQWNGHIDDVRIYKRPLSSTEVQSLYDSYSKPTLQPQLIAHWKLDETSGATLTDSGPYGMNGTWTDGANNDVTEETTAAVDGNGLSFNDTSTKITIPYNNRNYLELNDDGGTVTGWFKMNDATLGGTGGIFPIFEKFINSNINAGTAYGLLASYDWHNGKTWLTFNDMNTYVSDNTTPLIADQWYFAAATWSGGTVSLYLNGALAYTGAQPNSITYTSQTDSYIGWGSNSGVNFQYADGDIDDVRVYNYALDASAISSLYSTYTPPAPSIPTSGLIGAWNLNETSGASIADSSGNSVTGTWVDGANNDVTEETTAGKSGNALTFDGSSTFITMGDVNAYDGLSTITLSAWIKTTYTAEQEIFDKSTCTGFGGGTFELSMESPGKGGVYLTHGGASDYVLTTGSIADGSWHMLTATYDGSTIKIYVDGTLDSLTSVSAFTLDSNSDTVSIGGYCNGGSFPFNGNIDDVLIYNRALSASEISTMYNSY